MKKTSQLLFHRGIFLYPFLLFFLIGANFMPPQVAALPARRVVNIPHFDVANVNTQRLSEMAIFWFGKVSPTQNYTDVRMGYNDSGLYIHAAIFDRRVWFDPAPTPAKLTRWDTITLLLDTGSTISLKPAQTSLRFVAQFNANVDGAPYKLAYRGDGAGWVTQDIAFETNPGWRGNGINDNKETRGWVMDLIIPFISLGLSGPPSDGTEWRLGVVVNDRDNKTGTAITPQIWPEKMSLTNPSSWGTLHFGLPTYQPSPAAHEGTTMVRNKLNGQNVVDAAVGGTIGNLCPGSSHYIWYHWGNANFKKNKNFNIQNQVDVADWPCFAKYYVTFPLSTVPPGKVILSAKLVLHQFGGSDPSQAHPSLIQVFTLDKAWSPATLTWNNAPYASENVGRGWVNPTNFPGWPGLAYEFEISQAVDQAYRAGRPLSLALYSADADYHSGKYFVSSNEDDWNAEARPTLVVEWGAP